MNKNVEVSRIKSYSNLNEYFSTIQDIVHLFTTRGKND